METILLKTASDIGALIRTRRKALGMTQPDLAFAANVGVRFIVDIEKGKESCQIGRTMRLLEALGVTMEGAYVAEAHPHAQQSVSRLSIDIDE